MSDRRRLILSYSFALVYGFQAIGVGFLLSNVVSKPVWYVLVVAWAAISLLAFTWLIPRLFR